MPDLQAIFADTILKAELGPDEKDERVYDLNPLRSRQFQFVYGPESGIAEAAVKKLRLKVHGKSERIILEADPSHNKQAVFDLLDKPATVCQIESRLIQLTPSEIARQLIEARG